MALVLLPPVLFSVVWGGVWFFALMLIVSALIGFEWNTVTRQNLRGLMTLITVVLAALTISLGTLLGTLAPSDAGMAVIALVGALIAAFILSAIEAPLLGDLPFKPASETDGDSETASSLGRPNSFRWAVAGYPYMGMALLSIAWIRSLDESGLILIWLFFIVWATDVGGYFFGKGIGGPKLAPSISPKKTWSGFLGGIFLAVLASWLGDLLLSWHPNKNALFIVPLLSIISQVGDLFESHVKRRFEAKDSGSVIPGHGGLLDRIDGLIFAAPTLALILAFHYTDQGFGS